MNNTKILSYEEINEIIENWKNNPKKEVERLLDYYGLPSEYTSTRLIWHDCKPWKKTVLVNEEIPHNFPDKHADYLEQFIDYKVPINMYNALAEYDGSVMVERTKGLISARCGGTSMNFVAINLAHEIITKQKSIAEAREKYKELYLAYKKGEESEYTQKFIFQLSNIDTKDPDVSVM